MTMVTMPNIGSIARAGLVAIGLAAACASFAGPAIAGEINVQEGAAISGYDPVAYFTDNKPVKGSPEHTFTYEGATFRFASAAHRDSFAADPAKYAPQYGGYCAFGTARGYKAKIDPVAFTIVEGKLYLNYDTGVQKEWRGDIAGFIRKANGNWPTVKMQ